MKANESIRKEMRAANIPFWKLAAAWGCSEVTAVKRFRFELPPAVRDEVMDLIRKIEKEDVR